MIFKKDCVETTRNSKIKCEEHKRKIIFNNLSRNKISKIIVDDCQIREGKRCDCLIIFNRQEYFVELKGDNIKHAILQLKKTIESLGDINCPKRNSYIISSRSPLSTAEIQNYRIQFKKNYRSDLIVKNNYYEVDLE